MTVAIISTLMPLVWFCAVYKQVDRETSTRLVTSANSRQEGDCPAVWPPIDFWKSGRTSKTDKKQLLCASKPFKTSTSNSSSLSAIFSISTKDQAIYQLEYLLNRWKQLSDLQALSDTYTGRNRPKQIHSSHIRQSPPDTHIRHTNGFTLNKMDAYEPLDVIGSGV
jgi:hypothetical protein